MGYKVTPVSAKDLYPFNNSGSPVQPSTSLNTWNGPIFGPGADGKYHLYDPIYKQGSLLASTAILHGVADSITGPYDWFSQPRITGGAAGSNPAFVAFQDPYDGNMTKYTLWSKDTVWVADSPYDPFDKQQGKYPGGNPAPIFHKGAWYLTNQRTSQVFTTPKLGDPWTVFANITTPTPGGMFHKEDPYMWIDKRGNWHIVNHAFDLLEHAQCGSSRVSVHNFSPDGQTWHLFTDVAQQPYGHTVRYEDGTSHTYTTLERPNIHFDGTGQMTHINFAADMVTQDEGCASYTKPCPAPVQGNCACTNCKYADHAGTIVVSLDV
jgi:hypothetical protein